MNIIEAIKSKIKKYPDEIIMGTLNRKELKPDLHDWRNWGNNEYRMIAEEAFSRGLIN